MTIASLRAMRALVAFAVVFAPIAAEAAQFDVDAPKSSLFVDVHPTGKMSRIAHEHHLQATRWHGSFAYDHSKPEASRGEIVVEADSLHERSEELSDSDKKKVNEQVAGPQVLDAKRFPTIRMTFERLDVLSQKEGRVRGVLVGALFLHGQMHPITIPISGYRKGESMRVTGQTAFEQSKFGIKPWQTALGTVGIQDRVEIHFDLWADEK